MVSEEGKQRSTFVVLWRAVQERFHRHAERQREVDKLRMAERSTRGTTGFSTPVSRPTCPWAPNQACALRGPA